jgi:hypothetical protein
VMATMRWVAPLVAAAALVLTCIPSGIWHHPSIDVVQNGFDPNLMYATASADVTRDSATINAATNQSSINLLATPLEAFAASFDVAVGAADAKSVPFRVGVWSPWTRAGYFVQFDGGQNSVETELLTNGLLGPTLGGGQVTRRQVLGAYTPDARYRVQIAVDKRKAISVSVKGLDLDARDAVAAADASALFGSSRVALTASADSARTTLTSYSLTLPHQRYWADKVDDQLLRVIHAAVLLAAALTIVVTAAIWFRRQPQRWERRRLATIAGLDRRAVGLLAVAILVYLAGNAALFPLGGHPFDFGNEKLYAYVARTYGSAQLYYLPNVVSLARVWGGVPFVEAAFPYEPVTAYLYGVLGWMGSILFAGGGVPGLADVRLDYLLKAVNVAFGLVDAVLIFLIMRSLKTGMRWSLIAAGLFLFNPAVWFSMSIWGQTHVISLFFVLGAVLLAEKGRPKLAWIALAAGALTRPQMVVFALLLGIVLLRKFSWRQNLVALSWTVIVFFLALAPFTLATSPSLPIDILLNNFTVQEGGGNEVALTTVSQDAYSIWPLITYMVHGASGMARAFTPSSSLLVGSLSYQRVSQVLTVAALLIVSGVLLLRKRAANESGGYLPWVTLGIASFLMLLTGVVATHFVLALPFLLLCRRWMGGSAYLYVAGIWTVTTFVPMFGDMGVVLSSQDYPLLAPATNAVTRFFVNLYAWDRFITVGVVANLCALLWLLYMSVRATPRSAVLTPVSG